MGIKSFKVLNPKGFNEESGFGKKINIKVHKCGHQFIKVIKIIEENLPSNMTIEIQGSYDYDQKKRYGRDKKTDKKLIVTQGYFYYNLKIKIFKTHRSAFALFMKVRNHAPDCEYSLRLDNHLDILRDSHLSIKIHNKEDIMNFTRKVNEEFKKIGINV